MSFTSGSTGGKYNHTLTVSEMPAHKHRLKADSATGGSAYGLRDANIVQSTFRDLSYIESSGGNQPHNNVQPYVVVYFFKRTA